MGRYGGTTVDMITLEVGTKFYVCNGAWNGEIVLVNDLKHILIEGDKLENAKPIKEGQTLDINMKTAYEIVTKDCDFIEILSEQDLIKKYDTTFKNKEKYLVWEDGEFAISDMQGIMVKGCLDEDI